MFLNALRLEIGKDAFDRLLREWAARSANAPATTDDLKTLVEGVR